MSRLTAPQQVLPHLHIVYAEFPHRDSGNVYLVSGRSPALIDCGSRRAVPQIVENLARLGVGIHDLTQVIATHGDCDHLQGYHELRRDHPGLPIRIHPLDLPLVLENDPYRNASYLYRAAFEPLPREHVLPLADGERIPAGDTELTVVHTPGHTEGSVCLLGEINGQRVLFAGDTVGGSMRSLTGADLAIWAAAGRTWEHSLQRLVDREFDWVLTGHEPAQSLPISRARFERSVAHFGKMLNPWFSLSEVEEPEPESEPEPELAAAPTG